MNLNEAIKEVDRQLDWTKRCNRVTWTKANVEAVTVLLDAVRMRPATEPPDTNRWVLVKHNGPSGEEEWDRGYYDARNGHRCFYVREGDNCDAISWRELPE